MNKTMLITGGSSGIGAATVQLFLAQGYQVFNLDISPISAALAASESERYCHIPCDIRQHDSVRKHIAKICEENSIAVVICNAGKHLSANIENTSEAELIDLFNLNVKGAFSVIQSCLPSMKSQGFGRIILIASDQALIGKTNSFAYNLSKHALASIAKTTALDYAEFGITANAICPGTIDTPLYRKAIQKYCDKSGRVFADVHKEEGNMQPVGRIGLASEVADYALFLAKESSGFITGSIQLIDGGYTAQ
ncbi:SDR family NAD(P)-dependent oxidoreductase [Agaribacter flavus]|uniref:SDR family NAD(P)-dependent oxidoreductase n=1 Tax=Agaribacter flavus TaxID=1902781 RepID=A0ABV7FQU7_9ALTE